MFDPNNIFNALFLIPILNILIGIYKLLVTIHLPGALGFSLILLTVLIRVILYPLTNAQLKSAQKLSKLKPQMDKLQQQYKNNKQQLSLEQMKLYKEAGVNPAAGCLPLLIQMPILIGLYNLFFQILTNQDMAKVIEGINKVVYLPLLKISSLDLSFFGLSLAHKPSEWQKVGWWFLLIPVITAALQYWQTKMMIPAAKKTQNSIIQKEEKDGEKRPQEDMGQMMQKQMGIMMPLMIGFFAYSFPLGLSLYWNTFTVFGIIQQNRLNKQTEYEKNKNS